MPEVRPPQGFPPERVGFSNIILDKDGVLRRHLLAYDVDYLTPDKARCNANLSFNLLLANQYLKNPKDSDSRNPIELETETIFKSGIRDDNDRDGYSDYCQALRFTNGTSLPSPHYYTGGYQSERSIFGCQILLDYRSTTAYETLTVQEVLNNQLQTQNYRDRIILIGVARQDGFGDYQITPLTATSGEQMPGVVLQAQMVSQILDAVLGIRPLIWVLPQWRVIQWGEALWIFSWSLIGGLLTWYFQSPLRLRIAVGITGTAFYLSCIILALYLFCIILQLAVNGWLPFIPSVLALISTSLTVTAPFIARATSQERRR